MNDVPSTARGRWLIGMSAALPVVYFIVWYVAWFNHDDCLGALRQIGGADDALYRSTEIDCEAAASVRRSVESYGLGLLAAAELMLLIAIRRVK